MATVFKRHLATSATNSGAIEKNAQSIYIWGANTSKFIPYLPDSIIFDAPHLLEISRMFKEDPLFLPEENYKIVDIQMTGRICYMLMEQSLGLKLEAELNQYLQDLRDEFPAIFKAVKLQESLAHDIESFLYFFGDLREVVGLSALHSEYQLQQVEVHSQHQVGSSRRQQPRNQPKSRHQECRGEIRLEVSHLH